MGSLAVGRVIADGFKTTVQRGDLPFVQDELIDLIGSGCGGAYEREGLYRVGGGTLSFRDWHGVGCLSFSGDLCADLRKASIFDQCLGVVGSCAHRVTALDAALDFREAAAPRLKAALAVGYAGKLALTRKAVDPFSIDKYFGLSRYGGPDTGTVYFGKPSADVRLAMYDKRQEILAQLAEGRSVGSEWLPVAGVCDPGDLTRYELRFRRGLAMTLRDVSEPTSLFWHYMPSSLLPRPDGVPAWTAHGEGFDVEHREPDYGRQLEFLLDESRDVRRMGRIAAALGPSGVEYVLSRVRGVLEGYERSAAVRRASKPRPATA